MSACTKMTSIRMYVIFCYLYCKENQTIFPQSLYTFRSLSELENHKKFFIWKDVSVTWILQLIIYHLVSDRLTSFPEVVFSDTGFDILHCPKNNLTICIKTEPITLSVWHKSQTYSVAPAISCDSDNCWDSVGRFPWTPRGRRKSAVCQRVSKNASSAKVLVDQWADSPIMR